MSVWATVEVGQSCTKKGGRGDNSGNGKRRVGEGDDSARDRDSDGRAAMKNRMDNDVIADEDDGRLCSPLLLCRRRLRG